jgi:hypothetical protein
VQAVDRGDLEEEQDAIDVVSRPLPSTRSASDDYSSISSPPAATPPGSIYSINFSGLATGDSPARRRKFSSQLSRRRLRTIGKREKKMR